MVTLVQSLWGKLSVASPPLATDLQAAELTGMYLAGLMSRTARLQRLNGNSSAIVAVDVETESSTVVTAQRDRLTRLLHTCKKGKGRYSSSWEPHLRSTGYGIAQCYLPPDTSERAPPNPNHAGWYSIYLPRRDGRLS